MDAKDWRRAPAGKIANDIEEYVRWLKRESPSRPLSIPDTLAMLERAAEMLKGTMGRTRWELWNEYQGKWFVDYANFNCERRAIECARRQCGEMKIPYKVVRRDEVITEIATIKPETKGTDR